MATQFVAAEAAVAGPAMAKAHGMDGSLVEPDWPPITLEEADAVLGLYPNAGDARAVLTVSPRPFSAASVIETSHGKAFLKRHARKVRNAEGLLEEHRFLKHLRARNAPVARVFSHRAGLTALELGDWTYELHEVPAGLDLYGEALSWTPFRAEGHAYSAGRALGRLRLAAEGLDAPARKPRPLVASFSIFASRCPAEAAAAYLGARPDLARYLDGTGWVAEALHALAPFHAQLEPLLDALPPLWTHNDLHASNLFWTSAADDAAVACVLDFGLSDRTNAVHDIAHAIERNIVEWLALTDSRESQVPVHFDHLDALLAGYEEARRLTREEALALGPMLALCHAEFALSEADYFYGVLGAQSVAAEVKAAAACPDYLLGHARWFHTDAGRHLLDHLERWARNPARPGATAWSTTR